MKKSNLLLIAIILFGFLLRVAFIDARPSGFTPDEASFGYDAYSLIKTGQDQWGNSWPLVLKSFGDYKMPLYTYLSIPTVYLFGLNEAAVRLPNVLLGTLAILATYLLAKELFDKKVALFAALLLALSPWHIPMSRGAFEANLTAFFMPLGVYLFIKGVKKPSFMLFSALIFGFNLFTYHSARLVTPFVVLALVYSYKDVLVNNYKKHLQAAIVFSIFAVTGLYSLLQGSAVRASTSTIFSTAENVFHERVNSIAAGEPLLLAKLFNNKATYLIDKFVGNYTSYFSPEFLFINGAREGTYGMVSGMGLLFPYEAIALVVVIVLLVGKKLKLPLWMWAWLLIAPIPAAISVGPGLAANRAAIMMPVIQIISAVGVAQIYFYMNKKLKKFAPASAAILIGLFFIFFMENYLYAQPAKEAKAMIYGGREVMASVSLIEDQYDEVIITKSLSEPHIFAAFYNRIDPKLFQEEAKRWNFEEQGFDWVDQQPVYSLGQYTFKSINWHDDVKVPNILFVTEANNVPETVNLLDIINYPNGQPAYAIVDNKSTEFAVLKHQ